MAPERGYTARPDLDYLRRPFTDNAFRLDLYPGPAFLTWVVDAFVERIDAETLGLESKWMKNASRLVSFA